MRRFGHHGLRERLAGPWVAAAALACMVGACGEQPREATSFAIFERPPDRRDRPPQAVAAAPLRTQEQSGDLRLAGRFRGARLYLGRGGGELCLFAYDGDVTGSTCVREPGDFAVLGSPSQRSPNMAFVALPDGYDKAVTDGAGVVDQRLVSNGYAIAYRGTVTMEFSGSAGTRRMTLR